MYSQRAATLFSSSLRSAVVLLSILKNSITNLLYYFVTKLLIILFTYLFPLKVEVKLFPIFKLILIIQLYVGGSALYGKDRIYRVNSKPALHYPEEYLTIHEDVAAALNALADTGSFSGDL